MNSPETYPVDDNREESRELVRSVSLDSIGQTPLLPPRDPLGARIAGALGRHHSLLVVVCVPLLWAIIALPPFWHREPYQVGAMPGHDIMVPQQSYMLDREETRRRQDEAANLVTPDYDPHPDAQARALSHLDDLCGQARDLAQNLPMVPDAARLRGWRAKLQLPRNAVNDAVLSALLQIPAARWDAVENVARSAVTAVYKNGQLRSDVLAAEGSADLAAARTLIADAIRKAKSGTQLAGDEALAAEKLAEFVVSSRPNQVVNEAKTRGAREAARAAVPEVFQRYHADDVLVRHNEVITERKWAQMQELGIVTPKISLKTALARLALVIMLVCFGAAYLRGFHPRLMEQPASLWLAAMVPITFAFAFRLLLRVPHSEYLMVPLAATGTMLVTILLNARVGVVAGFVISAICSVMARADASWLLASSLSCWIGALSVADISSRAQVVRAGAVLAATNAVLIGAIGVLADLPGEVVLTTACWEAVAGVGSVALMAGLAMFLERPFGITTHLRLLELLSPDETVIRRMQTEAPGTFTHSFMVAMLSEAGAKAVGADALLCRVGGLYHDIGKLRRPHCFIENQSGHNIHDELSPQLSALIILAHVKDGLELGRALRLPRPVLDIIAQHHGTTVLSYFYNRALQGARSAVIPAADVDISPVEAPPSTGTADVAMFRYAGPRPQSKEAAIVLLADSIEASSRALPDVTPEKLREHIHGMIEARLKEGELSECELTLRDLGTIENAFTLVLRGAMHQRVKYPANPRELESDADWFRNGTETEAREERREKHNEKSRPENRPDKENGRSNGRRRRRRARKNDSAQTQTDASADSSESSNASAQNGTSHKLHEPRSQSKSDIILETPSAQRQSPGEPNGTPSETAFAEAASAESNGASNGASQRELEHGGTSKLEAFGANGQLPGTFPGGAPGGDSGFTIRDTTAPGAVRRDGSRR